MPTAGACALARPTVQRSRVCSAPAQEEEAVVCRRMGESACFLGGSSGARERHGKRVATSYPRSDMEIGVRPTGFPWEYRHNAVAATSRHSQLGNWDQWPAGIQVRSPRRPGGHGTRSEDTCALVRATRPASDGRAGTRTRPSAGHCGCPSCAPAAGACRFSRRNRSDSYERLSGAANVAGQLRIAFTKKQQPGLRNGLFLSPLRYAAFTQAGEFNDFFGAAEAVDDI